MKVLVAEDDASTRVLLTGALKKWGYDVTAVSNGEEAWEVLMKGEIRVVITDWEMPGLSGAGLCNRIRSELHGRYTYVLFLTKHDDSHHLVEGLGVGADDFIAKPFEPLELEARVAVGKRILMLQDELFDKNEALGRLTQIDEHTGLYNARWLRVQLDAELKRCMRFRRPLSLLFFDIDHFKSVNDTRGHLAGSETLRQVGAQLTEGMRGVDTAYRYGGDEFCLMLLETGPAGAMIVAQRQLEAFRARKFDVGNGEPMSLTVSIGVASYPDHAKTSKDLIDAADKAMYRAKEGGRNGVVMAVPTKTG